LFFVGEASVAKRFAVLLDGGFVKRRLESHRRSRLGGSGQGLKLDQLFPSPDDVLGYVERFDSIPDWLGENSFESTSTTRRL